MAQDVASSINAAMTTMMPDLPGRLNWIPDWLPFIGKSRRALVVALVRLSGVIGAGQRLRSGLSVAGLDAQLKRAFEFKRLKAVALQVNSPGGSPAQSSLIFQRIRMLADKNKVPVLAFVEDIAASGGYWLACAADEIYADESAIIGSIGVIYSGFGLDQAIAKLGIERRLHTAGSKKSILDPFLPQQAEDVVRLKALQREIHGSFKAAVKTRRGGRLKAGTKLLFSGEFWTGKRAIELGLIDGLGEMNAILAARYGEDVRIRPVLPARSMFDWLRFGEARGSAVASDWHDGGQGIAAGLVAAVEERLWWNRYGL